MSATTEEENCYNAKTEVPVCWICREETKETRGQRLSLGIVHVVAHFAHWTCLVQYAANKVADGGDVTK